jgi:hypothetical protein
MVYNRTKLIDLRWGLADFFAPAASQEAGITGMSHCTWPRFRLLYSILRIFSFLGEDWTGQF